MKVRLVHKGGKGSGHHGHAGRPGKRGGSLPGGAGAYAHLSDEELGDLSAKLARQAGVAPKPTESEAFSQMSAVLDEWERRGLADPPPRPTEGAAGLLDSLLSGERFMFGKPKIRDQGEFATLSVAESRIPRIQSNLEAAGFREIDTSGRRAFAQGDLSREYRKKGSRLAVQIGGISGSTATVRVDDLGFESD